jgi:nucleotide-binding universal stress UspA family protein
MRVLLAVNDSDDSVNVARTARALFGDEATYIVVSVGQPDMPVWGGDPLTWGVPYPLTLPDADVNDLPFVSPGDGHPSAPAGGQPSAAEVALQRAEQVSEAAELSSSTAIGARGDPAERIREVSTDQSVDVIVVGAHDRGGWLRRLLDPSVTSAVLRDADRPVLVVP